MLRRRQKTNPSMIANWFVQSDVTELYKDLQKQGYPQRLLSSARRPYYLRPRPALNTLRRGALSYRGTPALTLPAIFDPVLGRAGHRHLDTRGKLVRIKLCGESNVCTNPRLGKVSQVDRFVVFLGH